MLAFRRIKKFLPLMVIIGLIAVPGSIFFIRSPVLVITDPSFEALYGPMRLMLSRVKSSLILFRRLVPVTVTESAAPSLLALAAEEASLSPLAVIFPYRYMEGARLYKKEHEDTPVLVMGGRASKPVNETELIFIRTDLARDYYRAGLYAAVFAGESRNVLFFTDQTITEEYRSAFRSGLNARNFTGDPVFLDSSVEYSSFSGVGCVVVSGPASKFLEKNLQIPIICFSWTDPALMPRSVKLIFDDSPWALLIRAVKNLLSGGGDTPIPSEQIIRLDKEGKKDFRIIYDLVKEES